MAVIALRRLAAGVIGLAIGATAAGCEPTTPFESSQQVELAYAGNIKTLRVRNNVGDVEIVADPNATGIIAQAKKTAKAVTQADADSALADIDVALGPGDGEGVIEATAAHPRSDAGRNYQVRWTITAPPGVAVDLVDRVGDVSVYGVTGGVMLGTDVGDVSAEKIEGGMTIVTRVGDVEANGSGPVDAKSDVGDVRVVVHGAAVAVKAHSRVGDVSVQVPRGWKARATVGSNVGDVELDDGQLNASQVTRSRKRCEALLNGGGDAVIEISAQVGDVELSAGEPVAGEPEPR